LSPGDGRLARRSSPWLIVGIVAGGLAAVIAGVVFAVAISGTRGTGQAPASSTPSPSASEAPSITASPTPDPSLTPAANPILPNRAIAVVTVDGLNLRTSAGESAASIRVLTAGTQLFIIGDPMEAGELRWYRVADGFSELECRGDGCPDHIGWVATPTKGGEAWIVEADVDCPSQPLTADQFIDMLPLVRLHCYGNEELTGTGWVDSPCCGYVGPVAYTPTWLANPSSHFFMATDFHDTMLFRLEPGAGEEWADEWPAVGDIIRFTGHFEDPAAPTCRSAISADWLDDTSTVELEDPAVTVLACRLQFVVTDYEVIGHEGEGSCGCLQPPSSSALTGLHPGEALRRMT
jgi:hypothetical protein